MSSTARKLMSASGAGAGEVLNVEDVFSTYLYEGTGDNQTNTVTNNIDLAGEGGMVWTKSRDIAYSPIIFDSERGLETYLYTSSNAAQTNKHARSNMSFNSDGYSFGSTSAASWGPINEGNYNFVSWTFRKAPKFFDVVTYTGNAASSQTISHNLGAVPGFMVVKKTSGTGTWYARHRNDYDDFYRLNETAAASSYANLWANYDPTDVDFKLGTSDLNNNGDTYIAYLFAHNDGDGEFGPDGDADIIKCGSFSVNSSYEADVDIGFEPQWVLIKPAEDTGSWLLFDTMRGAAVNGDAAWLAPDLSQQEANTANRFWPTATGFHIGNYGITAGNDIIYIAIRRGTAVPESATEVFTPLTYTADQTSNRVLTTGIVSDAGLFVRRGPATANKALYDRLRGPRSINTDRTFGEDYNANSLAFDSNTGFIVPTGNGNTNPTETGIEQNMVLYAWERAPKYFDVVAYTGIGGNRTLSHNLDAAPEMMWVKSRGNSEDWYVYHKDLGNGSILILNTTSSVFNGMSNVWNNTSPTSSVFTVGPNGKVNLSGDIFIAYLFATLTSISKVGSYTGNGSNQTIDCGFTSGARFILIKRSNSTGDWYVWDTARGIVSGNDPHSSIDNTAVEATSDDSVDPNNSGFIVNQVSATNINVSSAEYIFYAIA